MKKSIFILASLCLSPLVASSSDTLLSAEHKDLIIEAAEATGLIRACGGPWEDYFVKFMQIERSKALKAGLPEEDMAKRISFMFGLAQRQMQKDIESSNEKPTICGNFLDYSKKRAMELLKKSSDELGLKDLH